MKAESMVQVVLCLVRFSLLFTVTGCESTHESALHVVFLPDLSRSIDEQTRRASAEAVAGASMRLARGDAITVIPITGAVAETLGNVGRFQFRAKREAFDGDVVETLAAQRAQLETMLTSPSDRSEILDAIALAHEELSGSDAASLKTVAILSDFIEDGRVHSFARDPNLASTSAATKFASRLASKGPSLRGFRIYLGRIPSVGARALSVARQDAIKAFWIEYLSQRGAQVEWATDGLGGLNRFIARMTAMRSARETVAEMLNLQPIAGAARTGLLDS